MLARLALILFVVGVTACARGQQDYAIGADVSFLGQAENNGIVFKDGGVHRPGLEILKDHGYNWIRLRLFHTPAPSCRTTSNTRSHRPSKLRKRDSGFFLTATMRMIGPILANRRFPGSGWEKTTRS